MFVKYLNLLNRYSKYKFETVTIVVWYRVLLLIVVSKPNNEITIIHYTYQHKF